VACRRQAIRTERIVQYSETHRFDLGIRASTLAFVATTDRPTQGGSRSERARVAILSAAAQLLDEVGFASMTIEKVATRAGAGKATIYRRWPTKGALAMDAVMAEIDPEAPFPDTGSAIEDFRLQLRAVARVFNRPRIRHTLIGVVFEAQNDPELRDAFAERYMNPRRDQARAVVGRGIARGELRAGFKEEVLFDQLYGALYFRLLVSGQPLNRRFTDELVDQAFEGLRRTPEPR
jgi:AcrR family transcriptional regulator